MSACNRDAGRGMDRCALRAVLLPAASVMLPRYRAGEAVLIDPEAVPLPGDDVLMTLRDGRVLVCELSATNAVGFELLTSDGKCTALPISEVQRAELVAGIMRRGAPSDDTGRGRHG